MAALILHSSSNNNNMVRHIYNMLHNNIKANINNYIGVTLMLLAINMDLTIFILAIMINQERFKRTTWNLILRDQ